MIERYYNNAIEQVFNECGKNSNNSLLIRYSNDFSALNLESVNCLKGQDDVFFVCHEFLYNEMPGAYEPYLSIIYQMYEKHETCSLEEFMEKCDVYQLHRPILDSYFRTGVCRRQEEILLEEAAHEQECMTNAICRMLLSLAKKQKIMLVLNRFQLATRSTMLLTEKLLRAGNENIGIILGVNEVQTIPEFLHTEWEAILEYMEDHNKVYHIGDSGRAKEDRNIGEDILECNTQMGLRKLHNMVELLDFEQAFYMLNRFERMVKFDNLDISKENHYHMLVLLIRASIMMHDLAKALETCGELEKFGDADNKSAYEYHYCVATIYMYLGKLEDALTYANAALSYAKAEADEYLIFKAELLSVQIQMSGWYNIFFCAQNIEISERLIEKLNAYHYRNHLGYVYIYAYDNDPNVVAKAYNSEKSLVYFSKGVAIAKEIGNAKLLDTAYQKNLMLASTNGMFEVALLYAIRIYESVKDTNPETVARIYSSIAYSLCAMGQNTIAQPYFEKSIEMFYHLRKPEDIAEVHYNQSLSCIMQGRYQEAENYLTQCIKAIEKLQLNSLRVCNISKLYGLLALTSILQGNAFNCERYLFNCKQFLNYILEKEEMENGLITVHDYAKSDDDLFLYNFSQALLCQYEGAEEDALEFFEEADFYMKRGEGNLFFCYTLFHRTRMELQKRQGNTLLCQQEEELLNTYEMSHSAMYAHFAENMKFELPPIGKMIKKVTTHQIEELIHNEGIERAYQSKKRQLDFIASWQKQFEVADISEEELVDTAMKVFINHFDVDRAVYIRYVERKPRILYNDTECEVTEDVIRKIEKALRKNTEGFAVSKISSNYSEHQDITSIFGDDNVCSLVAIPYFDNARIESILITYVTMKDNWHSSVNRYMLDEDDLNIYRLLFREMRYALNRLEAYEKIYEINTKLYLSAVTDQLTGIFNREGFYRKLTTLLAEFKHGKREPKLGLMFVDLDNFKPYNDTYGHDIGDLVLVRMSDIFKKLCRDEGFVCRYGGDEFLLVFYTDDVGFLEKKAKKIYEEIELTNGFEKEISEKMGEAASIEKAKRISCSIGITTASGIQSEDDLNAMIKRADDLLYSIKASTKGTYKL